MIRFYRTALFLICLAQSIVVYGSYLNDKVVRVKPLTPEHINYLRALEDNSTLDFWTDVIVPTNPVDIHIDSSSFNQYVIQFQKISLPYTVLIDDLQAIIDREQEELAQERLARELKRRLLGQARADIVGTYASYDDMVQFLQDKAKENPSNIRVFDIGKTFEEQTIKGIELKYNPSATRNIWIDCGIHAREWITPASCIWMVDKFIQDYEAKDPTITDLLNFWNVYIAPSLNPDGYEFSQKPSNRMWRKSRTINSGSSCIGVDLNRNYAYKWMQGGASNNPCSDTFAGKSAASEIETIGVTNFLLSKIGTWDMYMSIHSYGQWWFTPYGYSTILNVDYQKQLAFADIGSKAITAVNGRKYITGSVANVLYIASGSSVDWAYETLKCRFSYTIELPPTSSEASIGFVLPQSMAPSVCNETYIGMREFLVAVKKEVLSSSSG